MALHDRKLGRLSRTFDPAIPHLSALIAGRKEADPPPSVDYASSMPQAPAGFGMMLNDKLGDCMCAAYYHARQIWTFHATGTAQIASDADVELLYEKSCGYKPGEAGEGPGGTVQKVLKYLLKQGAPVGGDAVDRIVGFVEVDPRIVDDVKRTIYHAGVAYLGLTMPKNVDPPVGSSPDIWTVAPGRVETVGGHAVVAYGYDADYLSIVSWGRAYKMTWSFFAKYVDEAYAVADRTWHASDFAKTSGLTLPAGLTPEAYGEQMKAMT